MLVSRLCLHFRRLPHLLLAYPFSYEDKPRNTPFQRQLIQARTIDEFHKIYIKNKAEFTPNVYTFAIKTITKLLSSKTQVKFKLLMDIIKGIQAIDISTLTYKNINSFLTIFRLAKQKGFNLHFQSLDFQKRITRKYINAISEKPLTTDDLEDVFGLYYEIACTNNINDCQIISKMILTYIEQTKKNNTNITENQITTLMKCLSMREYLNKIQIQIRSHLFEQIRKNLNIIKINNTVQIGIAIDKMNLINLHENDDPAIKDITSHIFQNLSILQEKDIIDIVKSEHTSKYHGFMRIYEQIFNNIFALLENNGDSKVSQIVVLKIFKHLSSKLNLSRSQPENQSKFFNFISNYIQQQKDSLELIISLQELVNNNFFDRNQKQTFKNVLKENDIKLSVHLLYLMSIKNFDMAEFTEKICQLKVEEMRGIVLYRTIIILNRLKTNNTAVRNILEPLLTKFAQKYSTPEKFIEFNKQIWEVKNKFNVFHINQIDNGLFSRLPDPFQTQSSDGQYRYHYMQYASYILKPKDFTAFLQKNNANIKLEEIVKLLSTHIFDTSNVQSKKPLIYLLNQKALILLQSKNKKNIQIIISFLQKYNKHAVYQTLDHKQQHQLFQIIHKVINNLSCFAELKSQFSYFITVLLRYLTYNHRNYNLEFNYRDLLDHLSNKITQFSSTHSMTRVIIEQGLRLNTLTAKTLQTIDVKSIIYTSFSIKNRIQYIKDPTFCSPLDIITNHTLRTLLHNRNHSQFLIKNEEKVIQTIRNAPVPSVFGYAVSFNQPHNPTSSKIMQLILDIIRQKITYFQKFDIVGFFRNALATDYYHFSQYKQIAENIASYMQTRISTYSVNTHIQFIKFIISQPGVNPKEYYTNLADYLNKQGDSYSLPNLYFYLAHTAYQFNNQEVKLVEKIMNRHFYQGVKCFLMLQNKMKPQQRSDIATKIYNKIITFKSQQQDKQIDTKDDINRDFTAMNKLYYQYLKLAYPYENKSLQIPQQKLKHQTFSFKISNSISILENIARITQNELQKLPQFGSYNHVFKIKQYVFVILNPRRAGAINEHQFIKRAVTLILGDSSQVIIIPSNKKIATIKLLCQKLNKFLSTEQITQLQGLTIDKKEKSKTIQEQNQSNEN